SMPSRHREVLAQQASALSLDTILAGLDVLAATRERLRGSNHGRTLVEMALVRLGRLEQLASLGQPARLRSQGGNGTPAPVVASDRSPTRAASTEVVKKKPLTPAVDQPPEGGPVELTAETLPAVWTQTLQNVGVLLASELGRSELPAIFAPNTLV